MSVSVENVGYSRMELPHASPGKGRTAAVGPGEGNKAIYNCSALPKVHITTSTGPLLCSANR